MFGLHNPWNEQNRFRAIVGSAIWHPELGPGALPDHRPFQFGQSAAEFVNLLNSGPTRPQAGLLGGWWASSGQIGFTGFLPQALLGPLMAREDFREEQLRSELAAGGLAASLSGLAVTAGWRSGGSCRFRERVADVTSA